MRAVFLNRVITSGIVLLAASLLVRKGFSQDSDFYIFLAFGQSNMEGYPGVEAQDKTNVDSRLRLLPAVDWPDGSRKKGTWTTAVPPLCRSSTGLCPCDYFGRTLIDSLPKNIRVGIINVSVAGCAIDMFDKNKYQSYISGQADWMKNIAKEYGGNPYGRLVEIGKLAQKDGVIKGILFHQGETDAGTSGWANKVKGVYDNLITDLNLDASKTPFLAGDLVKPNVNVQNLPKTIQNCYVISSQGCEQRGDGLHFSAKGYRELGSRYGKKMFEIIGKTGVDQNKKRIDRNLWNSVEFRNGRVSVSFEIPKREFVTLTTYTPAGKLIEEHVSAELPGGKHTITFDSKSMPMGVFVLRMQSGSISSTRTIIVYRK